LISGKITTLAKPVAALQPKLNNARFRWAKETQQHVPERRFNTD
jgi:hypothetical protein